MRKQFKLLFAAACFVAFNAEAKRNSYSVRKNTYTQKPAFAGFGKASKANGKLKTKAVSAYFRPSSNYKFVNSYARSR